MAINTYIANPVSQTITDGVTNKAPSENVVFDALAGKQASLGFTPENVANKQTDLTASATKYPTVDAVNTGLSGKLNNTTDTFIGDLTLVGAIKQSYTETRNAPVRPILNEEYFTLNPSSAVGTLTDFHGVDLKYITAGSNINNLTSIYPFESQIFHYTSQNINRCVGMYSLVENSGNGSMVGAVGLQLWNRNRGSGTVTTSQGILIKNPLNDGGGAITNNYGIYIEDSTTATTHNYGIYSLAKSFINKLELGASAISTSTAEVLSVHNSGRTNAVQVTTVDGVGIAVSGTGSGFAGVNAIGSWIIGVNGSTTTSGGAGVRGLGAGSSGTQIGVVGQCLNAVTANIAIQANAAGATTNIALDITAGDIRFNNATNGTKIGTATTQKLAFWNSTPVVQQVLATGAGKTVDEVITLLQTLGLCRQS